MIFNKNYIIKIRMDYSNFKKIVSNEKKQIYIYKYNNIIKENDANLFKRCFNDWNGVSDDDINILKDTIAKYTDNNINIKGRVNNDYIELFDDNNTRHYYIRFTENIEIYYIEGVYISGMNKEGFELLLMMLSF